MWYDSKKQRVYITDGSEEVFEGFCFDVADLIYEFRVFGRGRLEDLEMTWDEPKKEEISIWVRFQSIKLIYGIILKNITT